MATTLEHDIKRISATIRSRRTGKVATALDIWRAVQANGGYDQMCTKLRSNKRIRSWTRMYQDLLEDEHTSCANIIKTFYRDHLLKFEQRLPSRSHVHPNLLENSTRKVSPNASPKIVERRLKSSSLKRILNQTQRSNAVLNRRIADERSSSKSSSPISSLCSSPALSPDSTPSSNTVMQESAPPSQITSKPLVYNETKFDQTWRQYANKELLRDMDVIGGNHFCIPSLRKEAYEHMNNGRYAEAAPLFRKVLVIASKATNKKDLMLPIYENDLAIAGLLQTQTEDNLFYNFLRFDLKRSYENAPVAVCLEFCSSLIRCSANLCSYKGRLLVDSFKKKTWMHICLESLC